MEGLSEAVGVPVSALKLVASLFSGYPLALVHRYLLFAKSETIQNLFFASTGMGMIYWCYGKDIIHSLVCTVMQWASIKFLGHSKFGLYFSFLFQFGYLLGGYLYTETEGYDICWTMPGCVMCLRLIGLAFDRFDGLKPESERRPDQKDRCITECPSFLEVLGFSYSFHGLMIGPQYPLSLYRKFIRGELSEKKGEKPAGALSAGLKTGALGIGLLIFSEVAKGLLPGSFMTSKEFHEDYSFLKRLGYVSATGIALMYKYLASWTVVNGATTITGMGYEKNAEGKISWNGLANVKLVKYWTAKSYGDMIKAFNVNTNDWVARYIFKRCRWMGSRYASHFTTLMFLAIWHGYHLCYFTMFALEFMVVNGEQQIFKFTQSQPAIQALPESVRKLFSYTYVTMTWGFCVIEFNLIDKSAWFPVWQSIHYAHWIFWASAWLGLGAVNSVLAKPSRPKTE